jgi:homoserine kinase type II
MSVFTTVSAPQLEAWLKNHALGTLVDLRGIAAGIENTNYFVTTSEGRFVLTLFEKLTAKELPFYLNLMSHLARAGVPCPAPQPDRTGALFSELNGKPASLVTRLEGADLTQPTPTDCAAVGRVLAQIHLAGRSYPMRFENPRGATWWQAVAPEIRPFLDDADATLLDTEIAWQAQQDFSALGCGPIHADLFRDNILFLKEKIAGVIDFYFACTSWWLYDVAITVNDWCLQVNSAGYSLDSVHARALLDAYHAVRPFTAAEQAAWPALLRAGALRFWVSRLYDFHLPRAGEMTHAKDPGHFQRVLTSHIANAHRLPPLIND